MIPKRYCTEEFITLRNQWYARLREEGFKDIEEWPDSYLVDFPYLKETASHQGDRALKATHNGKEAYFRICGQYLYSGAFKDKTERFVFSRHAEGYTSMEILEECRHLNLKTDTYDKIRTILRRHQEIIKEKARSGEFQGEKYEL